MLSYLVYKIGFYFTATSLKGTSGYLAEWEGLPRTCTHESGTVNLLGRRRRKFHGSLVLVFLIIVAILSRDTPPRRENATIPHTLLNAMTIGTMRSIHV
jgi:hypothetical protein